MEVMKTSRIAVACICAAVLLVTGCDSSTGTGTESDVTFEGRVTDEPGFGKAAPVADIEGAVVTASNVTVSGSTNSLSGESTTNADGRYELDVEGAAEHVILVAEKTDFESKTMVYNRGGTRVEAMPMTVETHAEADVYVEARSQDDDEDAVLMSDVALFVTQQVGAEVQSGSKSAEDVAAAIKAEVEARTHYVRDEAGDDDVEDARDEEREAFLQLQTNLSASTSAEAEAAALESFEGSLVDAYTEAGVTFETQARARQAGLAALERFGSASFEMRQKAEVLLALATAHAVETAFEAADASSERLDALVDARTTLLAEIRAASSGSALTAARASYDAAVEAELAAEADVQEGVLNTAREQIETTAKTALEAALIAAGSAEEIAAAHATFYAAAETSAEASLDGETSKASLAATVLALLSAS